MEILEHELIGKSGNLLLCEDAWTATKDFACVIDGATTKGDLTFGQQTVGKMASLLLKESMKALNPQSSCKEAIAHFTDFIANFYREHDLKTTMLDKPWNRLAASMAVYSVYRQEVWLIGDCQCWVDGQAHTVPKEIDTLLSDMRSNYIKALLQTGTQLEDLKKHDLGREFVLPMLKNQSKYQNALTEHPYTYTVIDGFEVNPKGIRVIPIKKSEEVVLASDGYPKLFPSLKESEAYLAKILEEDPLCYQKFLSTKGLQVGSLSFDDRVYLKVTSNRTKCKQ